MATDSNGHVSFTTDVEEASPVDNGGAPKPSELSQSAKVWDLDGDGELNDTEKALKDLDRGKTGTLTKDQMYQLMHDNRAVHRELSKVKKIVIGLVVFTCLLALANVGMSFAAAFLAKDTTTSEGKLVDSKTGEALATDSTSEIFTVDNELHNQASRERRLQCGGGNSAIACDVAIWGAVSEEDGKKIIQKCNAWKSVTLRKINGDSDSHLICQAPDINVSNSDVPGLKQMTINRGYGPVITIKPFVTVRHAADTPVYAYAVTGLGDLQDTCLDDIDHDCGDNRVCEDDGTGAGNKFCKGLYLHTCSASSDCATNLKCEGATDAKAPPVCARDIGHACDDASGEFCGSGLMCDNGICAGDIGYECDDTSSEFCGSGLMCDNGICAGDIGYECYDDGACGSNLRCSHEATLRKLQEVAADIPAVGGAQAYDQTVCVRSAGHPCDDNSAVCGSDLVCEANVCKGEYLHPCAATSDCSATLGGCETYQLYGGDFCVGAAAIDEACSDTNPCGTDLKCEDGTGTTVCKGDIGSNCPNGDECGGDLICDGGKCMGGPAHNCPIATDGHQEDLCYTGGSGENSYTCQGGFFDTSDLSYGKCQCTMGSCGGQDEVCTNSEGCQLLADTLQLCQNETELHEFCGDGRECLVVSPTDYGCNCVDATARIGATCYDTDSDCCEGQTCTLAHPDEPWNGGTCTEPVVTVAPTRPVRP